MQLEFFLHISLIINEGAKIYARNRSGILPVRSGLAELVVAAMGSSAHLPRRYHRHSAHACTEASRMSEASACMCALPVPDQ